MDPSVPSLPVVVRALMRERILDELIEIETWDWWKQQVFQLRSSKEYEAEALFLSSRSPLALNRGA